MEKNEIKMIPVESSIVQAIGHKDDAMVVDYHKGATYVFLNVSKEEFESVLNADSVGVKLKDMSYGKKYVRLPKYGNDANVSEL
jgi:hypothetical protein